MNPPLKAGLVGAITFLAAGTAFAQFVGGWGSGGRNNDTTVRDHTVYTESQLPGGEIPVDEDTVRTAREVAPHSTESMNWTNSYGFEKDVWSFARIKYQYNHHYKKTSPGDQAPPVSWTSSPWGWITDYPDSDLNLSYRVQQMTSIKVDPDGRTLFLGDPELFDYPWIYMVEVGRLQLRDEEVPILRKYLLNGGLLMVDDFWGKKQWDNFAYQMKRVFPENEFVDLTMDHPIFHSVFDLKVPLNKLQTPNSGLGKSSLLPGNPAFGLTWESYHDDYDPFGAKDMHVRALFDDKKHIMVIATHNCDNGDGWEKEGEDDLFFHEYSEKRAFPLGINIIFYTMTH